MSQDDEGPNLEMPNEDQLDVEQLHDAPVSERKPLEVIQGGKATTPRSAPAPVARQAAPAPPQPPARPATIIIRMTKEERTLFPILVRFGQHLLHGIGMRPANPRAAVMDLQKRALSFQMGIPYEVLVPEIVGLEEVEKQPTTPAERMVRVKGAAAAPAPGSTSSILLGTNGRPLER